MAKAEGEATFEFLPSEWHHDEDAMSYRFQPFLKPRDANPVGYDAKIKFWQQLVLDYCEKRNTFAISANSLKEAFKRKGEKPLCLHSVLESMHTAGVLRKLEDYEIGWLGWCWNIGSRLLQTTIAYVPGYKYNAQKPVDEKADLERRSSIVYVHPTTLEKCKQTLLAKLMEQKIPQVTKSCIVAYVRFEELLNALTNNCVSSKSLLATGLKRKGKIIEFSIDVQTAASTQNQAQSVVAIDQKVSSESSGADSSSAAPARYIKVCDSPGTKVTAANADELNRLRNLLLQNVLTLEIESLEQRIQELNKKALARKAAGDQKGALACIAQRRRVETSIESKNAQRINLQDLLARLDEAELNSSVVAVLEKSNTAFRQFQADQSYSIDSVNNVLDDTNDAIRENQEIGDVLVNASRVNDGGALTDYSEMEAELEKILREPSEPQSDNWASSAKSTPISSRSAAAKIENIAPASQPVSTASKQPRKQALPN